MVAFRRSLGWLYGRAMGACAKGIELYGARRETKKRGRENDDILIPFEDEDVWKIVRCFFLKLDWQDYN